MKYVMVVPDGMSDTPVDALGGRTPLMAARTPTMEMLSQSGEVGRVLTVPEGMYPGSDVANMALMGYDPQGNYSGRGPLEAAAMGVPMEPRDVAFRCSLVSTDGERMADYSAGGISTKDAQALIALIEEKLSSASIHFFPGVGYRHVMRWSGGPVETRCMPPHEMMNEPLRAHYPQGEGEERLRRLIEDSYELLDPHPINRQRRDEGKPPANMTWYWGQGRVPPLKPFAMRWGLTGAVVAAVDLIKGLGKIIGLETPDVPGATGYVNTDYRSKGQTTLQLLEKHDFVYTHIEAPDEAGHHGDLEAKIYAIEQIDQHILAPVVEGLRARREPFRLMVVPDHATPLASRTHASGPVPYLCYDSRQSRRNDLPYDESILSEPGCPFVEEGFRLIGRLLEKEQ